MDELELETAEGMKKTLHEVFKAAEENAEQLSQIRIDVHMTFKRKPAQGKTKKQAGK